MKVFVDLEMKPVSKLFPAQKRICRQETIEFGAVKLNGALEETAEFRMLVKPVFGEIPPRYEQLTGITNEAVQSAPSFEEALAAFESWCSDAESVYAWSPSDLEQLQGEKRMKKLTYSLEALEKRWVDFQRIFTEAVGLHRELSLEQAVNIADISFTGKMHDALWDARNTAELFRIYSDKERFEKVLTPLKKQVNNEEPATFSLAAALAAALEKQKDK